ncbi:MAG: nuclear transport factor 2 family protein [Deltaproteobacteria bacterium]|nr:nuclear transport factor 2 family protein [Deltaproteobacteria bacterium]
MSFLETIERARAFLERQQRVSLRALRREFGLDTETLDELIEELVDVQRVARREDNVLVWSAQATRPAAAEASVVYRPADQPMAHAADARKVVTILFADLAGSTGLHERLDPESVNAFMENYYRAMRGAVEAHRGTVVKFLGDGVMAAFGVPRVAEDDAMRAVRAGVAMQNAFREFVKTLTPDPSPKMGEGKPAIPPLPFRERGPGGEGAIGLRVAINTGEVVVSADNTDVVGDPVNVAARLQQEARNGDVVLGESTHRLVAALVTLAPLGSVTLKGRAGAVKAYRVESLERPVGTATAAFVGRDDEMGRMTAVYDAAIATPAARLAVLLGSPGLGKSRMIEEFACRLGDVATVLTAQCDAAGGATFAPLAEALRELLSADDGRQVPLLSKEVSGVVGKTDLPPPSPLLGKEGGPDPTLRAALEAAVPSTDTERPRIVAGISALLAGSPASPEETFFVIRRFLAALASAQPVVLVIDDLHWAEPLLLDLVEHLVQWGSGVPLLVLVGARPELRDLRSSLVTPGGLVADVLTLAGLDAGAAMRLAANVIGAADLPAAVAAKVLATSEGNPLFVGELVRMLVQEGALTKEGDRWIPGVALAALEMPPTIHALLAARIERLRPEERSVLERAAVVGRHFSRNAVAELLPRDVVDLDARLEALRRTELIERDTGWFLGEPVLRFHHVLIRDAAYRRLLKGTRAELHARFADWVTARADATDHDETIGWHLEQAHQLLGELGPLDAAGRALGERAAQHLAAAGRRALARDDLPVAANLLGRAVDRLDVDDAARADLALDWCEALLAAGDVGPAAQAIDELGRFADLEEDAVRRLAVKRLGKEGEEPPASSLTANRLDPNRRLSAWHTCFTSQLTVLTAPQGLQVAADAVAEAAQQLTALGDAAGEAKAHSVHATALARLGKVGACEAALDKALAAARRAADRRRANAVLAGAPLAALWGPSPVTRASGRCLDVVRVLRITQGAPAVESVALSCQGVLEALRGRTEAARRMLASSRKMVEELGIAHRLFEADAFSGRVAAMEGDTAAAERLLRSAYEGLRDLGLGIDAARAGALLARTLLAQDRIAEAEALSHESERLAGDDLQAAIAWRGVRAEALAKSGEHAAAVDLAKAAVAIASATDALLDHADARVALATALRAAGRGTEADAEERRAIELWEVKGATLLAERARRDGGGAAPGSAFVADPIAVPRAVRRRVRPNAATSMQARFDAALAARDFDAIASVFHKDHREIDHPTGSSYGRGAAVASLQRLFRSRHPHYEVEPLATLGESLLLVRRRSGAAGTASARYDVGAYENEAIQLFEVDERTQAKLSEVFAGDRLGEAITRLYARYAELLPDTPSPGRSGAQAGPERERAAATARSVAVVAPGGFDRARYAEVFRSDVEIVDHKLLGLGTGVGVDTLFRSMAAGSEVGHQLVSRPQDVLALTHDALLLRWLASGVGRESGGAFEWAFLRLFIFDPDGRVARYELFDADREAEALARFDELTSAQAPPGVRRRVTPNAGSAAMARIDAALATSDLDAFAAEIREDAEEVSHPTGATYGREAMLHSVERFLRLPDAKARHELLATMGDRLWLFRRWMGASAAGRTHFDVGEHEKEEIGVNEVDAQGLAVRNEIFAAERLGDALVRLYARFAELLPEGAQRARAAGIARSLGAWNGRVDLDRLRAAVDPSYRNIDHRVFGTWSTGDAAETLRHYRLQLDLAPDFAGRYDEVFAANARALVARMTFFGTARDSGGPFENQLCALIRFGADGSMTHTEVFEAERVVEALVRFDELIGCGTDSVADGFDNAAARADRQLFDCFNARDWAGVEALAAPELVFDERRRMLHNTCGREVWLEQFRVLFDVPASRFTTKLLATRGERLSLSLHCFAGEVAGGGGPLEMDDHFVLHEVDGAGRIVAIVLFDLEDLDAAYAELDRRFEAGEAAARRPSWESMWGFVRAVASRDYDAVAALCAESLVEYDHRSLAVIGTTRGAQAWVQNFRTLADLSPDTFYRVDHFRAGARGYYSHGGWHGTREGGPYEIPLNAVIELDARGRVVRADIYDDDGVEAALARFAELAGSVHAAERERPPLPRGDYRGVDVSADTPPPDPLLGKEGGRFANAASATTGPVIDSMVAHDWRSFEQLFAENFRMSDRRRVVQLELDRDRYVAFTREVADGRTLRGDSQVLATRGDQLALNRSTFEFMDADVGPSEIAFLILTQVDHRGRIVAFVRWDLDDLDAAYAELDARWTAGEAAAHPLASKWLADYLRFFAAREWNAMTTLFVPELVGENHRLVGWGTLHGPGAIVSTLQAQIELAPDTQERVDHVRTGEHAVLFEYAWHGTYAGGAFENLWIVLVELDAEGRGRRADVWEAEQLDQALARFAAIGAEPNPSAPFPTRERGMGPLAVLAKPNAAAAFLERAWAALDVVDLAAATEALATARVFFAPDFVWEDRRPIVGLSGGLDLMLASARERLASGARHQRRTIVGTAGDRVAVGRILWAGGPPDGRFEVEFLAVHEVNEAGLCTAQIFFDPDDARTAQREAWARWAAIDPVAAPWVELVNEFTDAWNGHERARVRACFADDFVLEDHRHAGLGRIEGAEAYVDSIVVLWDLAPDQRLMFGWSWPVVERHGIVVTIRRQGTVPDGGPFESEHLALGLARNGRFTRVEFFEIDALDTALARFEELQPGTRAGKGVSP